MNAERTKVDWDKFKVKLMKRDDVIKFCKDTNYDTDGGFWDSVGDWLFGENFDYASLEKALANFFNCCNNMLLTVSYIVHFIFSDKCNNNMLIKSYFLNIFLPKYWLPKLLVPNHHSTLTTLKLRRFFVSKSFCTKNLTWMVF